MSLKGNLQSVDLANVLQMLSINQKEGTLVLFDGEARKSIYFSKDGVSMLSRGRRVQDTLGRILLRYGQVTPEVLEEALTRQKAEGRRLGEVLQAMGSVSAEDVENAVRTQIEEEIYNLFIWREASFEFIEGPPPPALEGVPSRVTFNVQSLIMEAQRRADEWNYIRGLVPSLDEIYRPTERMADAVVTDDVFRFAFAQRLLTSLQEGRLNVSEVIEASCAAKFEACKILAILLEQGAIEPVSIAELQQYAQESLARNDHAQAAKFLSRVVELGGATPQVNMSLGYALESMDEPERASVYFKAAADSFIEGEDPRQAFDAWQRVARALPTDLPAVTQMVEIACNNADLLAANRHEVVESGRTLAQCLRELGRLPASIQVLHKLAQASPGDLGLRNMLVQAYLDSGMNNEAMGELESMADSCANQKNYDEAIRCLRRVASIDRNRPGVLKRIETLTRQRDSGKRILVRAVAVGAVAASVAAAVWGFGYYRDQRFREQERVNTTVSSVLDPIRGRFEDEEKNFQAASKRLEDWRGSDVPTIRKDWEEMDGALRGMENLQEQTQRKAAALYEEHGGGGYLSQNFVEERSQSLRRRLNQAREEKGVLYDRIQEATREMFTRVQTEALTYPLRSIDPADRVHGILDAIGAPFEMGKGSENAKEFLGTLRRYKDELAAKQQEAKALWDEGRFQESHEVLAKYLATYGVQEFSETLRFRVQVRTVPAEATVRVVQGPGEGSPAVPSPAVLEYTAAAGLKFEVAAPGFRPTRFAVEPYRGVYDFEPLRRLPFQLKVTLVKEPAWVAALGQGGVEATPVPTPDGTAVVASDRDGWVHLVSMADGRILGSWDAKSPSGFRGSAAVTKDAAFVASVDGVVAALDFPSLSVRWRKGPNEGPGPVYGAPVLAGGALVVGGAGGTVAAYDPKDGNLLWEAKLPSGTREDLLFEGGWIVVSCEDGMARAIRDGGREVIAVLPTPREEASYPSPKSRPLAVKGMVLFGSEGTGREFSLVELPVPGAASPHIGYRWGAREEGAEVSGAAAGSGELFLLFSNGILRRVSLAQGPRPGDRAARVLPPKEKAVGAPVVVDQTLLVASEKGLIALQRGQDENVEIWKWTAPEGMLITTGPVVAGRTVVLCSRDGRMHALRRD